MTILIADDEPLIREMLANALRRLDYHDLAEAQDGNEAFERIRSLGSSVRMVIADIRMPGMDGLELLSSVQRLRNDILFIFVSGYDLFEYAREAVRLGAFGYLLKPVKEDELRETLERAEKKLVQAHKQQVMISSLQAKMNQGIQFMRKHFILDIASEYAYSEAFLNDKFEQLGIRLPFPCFSVLYLSVDNYYLAIAKMPLQERDLVKFSLDNIVSEIVPDYEVTAYYFEMEDGLGVLLNYPEHHPLADPAGMTGMCGEICKAVASFTKFTVTIGVGLAFHNIMELSKSFECAQKAVGQRLIRGSNQVFRYAADAQPDPSAAYAIHSKVERELQAGFEQLDIQATIRVVTDMYAPFRKAGHADADNLMKLNFQLIMQLFKFAIHKDIVPEEVLGDELKLYNQVNSCSSVDEITEWFQRMIQTAFDLIRDRKNSAGNRVIDKAKEFIHQHYAKDLSLEIVAQTVYLSPSYFSKLFKEETGENFSNYVLNYRIDAAKSLLAQGIYKANQVAEMVGFQDDKYFYKVFKKQTGFTPSEYKRS